MKSLNIKGAGTRALGAVRDFTVAQRTIAIIGVAVLVLGGVALAYFATKPTYSPLFTGLSTSDAAAVVTQLQKDKVDYQLSDGGATILVPADKVDQERLSAASAGLPSSTTSGYALLDSLGVTASQFQQNVTYERAIEGVIAQTIEGITGITNASVQLAIPTQSVYTSEQQTTTASVFVNTSQTLTSTQVQAIVHLVSSSVPGLTDSNVTVVDQNGNTLSTNGTTSGSTDAQTATYNANTKSAVQAMLDSVLGPGNSTVTVSADISAASGQSTTTSYSQPTGAPATSQSSTTSSYKGAGAASAAGTLGSSSSTSTSTSTTGNSGDTYSSNSTVKDNALDKTVETKTITPGTLNRQTIAVAINSAKVTGVSTATIQNLVAAAAGVNASRGDVVTVASMSFSKTAAASAKAALAQSQAQAASSSMMQLITTGVTVVGGLIALVLILLFLRKLFAKSPAGPVDGGELLASAAGEGMPAGFDAAFAGQRQAPRGAGPFGEVPTVPGMGQPFGAPVPTQGLGQTATATLTRPIATGDADDAFAQMQADVDALAEDPQRAAQYLKALMDDRSDA